MAIFLTIWLLVISAMDIRSRRVPLWLLATGGGMAALRFAGGLQSGSASWAAVLIGVLPGTLLLLMGALWKKVGYGDGMVAVILGMWTENGKGFLVFGVSLFLAAVWSLALLGMGKAGRNAKIPYLPFLTAAWMLVCLD